MPVIDLAPAAQRLLPFLAHPDSFIFRFHLSRLNGIYRFSADAYMGGAEHVMPRLLSIETVEGENPPVSVQKPDVDYVLPERTTTREEQLVHLLTEWDRRHRLEPHKGWNYWSQSAPFVGVVVPHDGHAYAATIDDRVWTPFFALLRERFEVHAYRLRAASKEVEKEELARILADYERFSKRFNQLATINIDAAITDSMVG